MPEIPDRSLLSSPALVLNVIARSKRAMTFIIGRILKRLTVLFAVSMITGSFFHPKRMKIPFTESEILIKPKAPEQRGFFFNNLVRLKP
jgi:hypothetical protein